MTADQSNYYELLGVQPNATAKELRQAYLHLLVTAHPDKGGSTDRFAAIQHAYAILSNPAERVIFDEQLERKKTNNTASNATNSTTQTHSNLKIFKNGKGATAIVHGQTQGTPQPQSLFKKDGSTAAQQNNSMKILNQDINRLTSEYSRNGGKTTLEKLVALHVERAAQHCAAGKRHHAAFDAEEALRLDPQCSKAYEMLQRLQLEEKSSDFNS